MMGELKYFLGFQVKQLHEGTFISQTKYIQDILTKFGMKDAKPIKTPMGTSGHLDLDTGGKFVDQKVYRSMIGFRMHVDRCRRFETGGSLSRRVNVAACPSPDGSSARASAKGGKRGGRRWA